MAILLAYGRCSAAVPAVSFLRLPGSSCGAGNVEGWEFQTTESITVSALGMWDYELDGFHIDIPIGLYDASCTALASVTIPAGTGAVLIDGHRYVGIAPIILPAGQTFRLAALLSCDDFSPDTTSLDDVSFSPGVSHVQTRRIAGATELACPTQASSLFGFGPNVLIGPPCGNGVLQAGEECDDGNTADGDCCSATCEVESENSPCPDDGNPCTMDACDAIGLCTHVAGNAGALCRPDAGECDIADYCDGQSPACPPDQFAPDMTACSDDGLFCTGPEVCQAGICASSGDPCPGAECDEQTKQCVTPTASPPPTVSASPTATRTPTPMHTFPVTATGMASATSTGVVSATPTVAGATATATDGMPPTPTGATAGAPTATATAPASNTASVTAASAASPTATLGVPLTPTATASPPPLSPVTTATDTPPRPCVGDCTGDGVVAVNELITGVTIALGLQSIDRCPTFDASGNGAVEVNELITAVVNALNGCS